MSKAELLFLSVGIFLTIIAWTFADIYHVSKTKSIKTKIKIMQIGHYNIDKNIIKLLKNRQ